MEYRGFKLQHDGKFGYYHVKAVGRGSVPVELRGTYTTPKFAEKDIDAHLDKKGKKDGKAKSSNRD